MYAVYLNGFNVVFVKSTDHGKTWSHPVKTYGKVSWNDKPALATSANGRHIYLSWNGPNGGDPWIAQSHDFGDTWSQTRLVHGTRYFFAYDGVVLETAPCHLELEHQLFGSGSGGRRRREAAPLRRHATAARRGRTS